MRVRTLFVRTDASTPLATFGALSTAATRQRSLIHTSPGEAKRLNRLVA